MVQRGRLSRAPIRSVNEDDRPVGAKRELGTEDPAPRVEDVTEPDGWADSQRSEQEYVEPLCDDFDQKRILCFSFLLGDNLKMALLNPFYFLHPEAGFFSRAFTQRFQYYRANPTGLVTCWAVYLSRFFFLFCTFLFCHLVLLAPVLSQACQACLALQ